jgi:Tol biopolymer transport system component
VRIVPPKDPRRTQDHFKVWCTASGKELVSIPAEERGVRWEYPVQSPDGGRVAVVTYGAEKSKLYVFDLQNLTLHKTVMLDQSTADVDVAATAPAFSPDGKWIAVIVQSYPKANSNHKPTPEDRPQPRIHLIDVLKGKIHETLISPPAFTESVCFSPDGKTLASGGYGKVVLWDLTDLATARP